MNNGKAVRDEHDMKFDKLLKEATKEFLQGNLGGHSTTTYTGALTRFDRIDKKKELIIRVCRELEDNLTELFADSEVPYYLGISNVQVSFAKNKEEYESGEDNDSDNIDCDIWEQVSDCNYDEPIQTPEHSECSTESL